MGTRSETVSGREAYWRGQVAAWARSGESVRGYCRARDLSEPGFHFWKREIKRRDEWRRAQRARAEAFAGTAGTGGVTRAKLFVRSREPGMRFAEVQFPSSAAREALIEIAVAGSGRVHVHPGFDEETLARVIAVLERAECSGGA